jgi:hypothetical protein
MQVLRANDEPVAFLANGITLGGILEVHPEHRGHGYGRELADHGIRVGRAQGANVLDIECTPFASLGFWKHLGFEQLRDHYARMVLETNLPLPQRGSATDVTIDYFREGGSKPRTRRFEPPAVRGKQGQVHLGQRMVFDDSPWYSGDAIARISVDGVTIYGSKVKYEEAEALGIKRDDYGVYYLDSLTLLPHTSE